MEYNYDFETWMELVEKRDIKRLRGLLEEENPVDIADFLGQLSREQAVLVFRALGKELGAQVFAELEPHVQEAVVVAITDQELSAIIEDLFVDDAVDMLEEMPANLVKRVLKTARPETRQLINQFLNYPENSAGSIMTAEFIDLHKNMTVQEAIARIRRVGADSEQIYTCYVMDERRRLEGVVTVKELLLTPDEQPVEQVMEADVITALTTEDREETALRMRKYSLLTLPVVDKEQRLVGIVTADDVMEVLEQEATEDFEKMAAMAPSERPYLRTSAFTLARKRIVWLLVLMISGMITGSILGRYEHAFAAIPLLVTFIPMLTDTGGNSGSQSSTLIIRGMAVGEIDPGDFMRVLWKELRVSLLVGLALSAVNYARLLIMYPGNAALALVVALSLLATVVIAKTVGGLLPMAAKVLKVDPALMAAPLITTIVDALALVIYFNIAQRLLGI